jgi:hypothetical protein
MKWKKLNVIGQRAEINNRGDVRQECTIIQGKVLYNMIRQPTINPRGIKYIAFHEGPGKQQNKFIHIMVAEMFIPNPHGYKHVRFKNPKNKLNCSISNLYWSPK